MININKKIFTNLFLIIISVALGVTVGIIYERDILEKKLGIIHPIRENNPSYKFINPLLAYIIPSADADNQLSLFRSKIENFINTEKNNNKVSNASMFFYDLNRGHWIGVNEKDKYNPASMLKVVVMVAYFKEAELDPNILNKSLVYTKEIDDSISKNSLNSQSNLVINKSYVIEDLINKMIIDSDNGAAKLLLNNINKVSLDSIYNALNIENPENTDNFTISPRKYSLFFRILYSSTYLTREYSEKALKIISEAKFSGGIANGLPQNLIVSHKFGVYINEQKELELHDCGIVYYPNNPYFLCIMTQGQDISNLKNVIKNISSLTYDNYINYK